MRQSSQGETQFINTDLSEKMLISEINTKNVGFVDIIAAFQRSLRTIKCYPAPRLPIINVTHHQVCPPSRSPSFSSNLVDAEQVRKSLRMTQALLDLWMSQSSQGETQFINRDLSEKMLISEIESKNHGFVDIMVALQRCYTPSRLPQVEVINHHSCPPSRSPSLSAN